MQYTPKEVIVAAHPVGEMIQVKHYYEEKIQQRTGLNTGDVHYQEV